MSDDGWSIAPPPFDPVRALEQIRRALRDCGLAERGPAFELRGRRVVELQPADGAIDARIARRPALTPEFDRQRIASAADQRKLVDEVRRRLERWQRDDAS